MDRLESGERPDRAPYRSRREFPLSRTPLPRISPLVPPQSPSLDIHPLESRGSTVLETRNHEKGDLGSVSVFVAGGYARCWGRSPRASLA